MPIVPQSPSETNQHKHGFYFLMLALFILHILTLNEASNYALFQGVNDLSIYIPQSWQALVSDFGNGIMSGALMLCFLVKRPELIVRVLIAAGLSLVFIPLLKQYFDAPRPAAIIDYLNIIGEVRYKHSFPSGHTATAFLFAGLVYLACQNQWQKYCAVLAASLVGMSRVLIGAHWPADVVMGAIVGLSCAYVATSLCPLINMSYRKRFFSYLLILAALVVSELQTSYDFPDIPVVQYVRWFLLSISAMAVCLFAIQPIFSALSVRGTGINPFKFTLD